MWRGPDDSSENRLGSPGLDSSFKQTEIREQNSLRHKPCVGPLAAVLDIPYSYGKPYLSRFLRVRCRNTTCLGT